MLECRQFTGKSSRHGSAFPRMVLASNSSEAEIALDINPKMEQQYELTSATGVVRPEPSQLVGKTVQLNTVTQRIKSH